MKQIQKVTIIGLGAIGCAYGSRLLESLPSGSLDVIAGGKRGQGYRESGVEINGKIFKFDVKAPEEKGGPADLIIFAVKSTQLEEAIEDGINSIGPDTIILSLLNGITSEEIIGKAYGMERMLYSVAVGIDAVRQGRAVHFANVGRIVFGEASNDVFSGKVQKVKELFDRCNIPYEIPVDMMHLMWWKFMVNVGINQTSAVLKAPYGVFQNVKEAYAVMEQAMWEVIHISRKAGVSLSEDDLQEWHKVLHKLSPQGKTSMLQDIEAHRKTEVDIFAGTVIGLGKKYGIPTPVNQTLYHMIRTLEEME